MFSHSQLYTRVHCVISQMKLLRTLVFNVMSCDPGVSSLKLLLSNFMFIFHVTEIYNLHLKLNKLQFSLNNIQGINIT
jgi:hypothetical protein